MKTMRHVQTWLLITLLTLSANGDVWGKRLETNWNGSEVSESQTQGNQRGYTDHEHLDSIGLIHMNGRVYEAAEVARGIATGEITGQEAVTGAVITAGLNLVGGAAFKTVNKVTPPVVKEQIKDVVDKALRKNTDAQQNLSDSGTPLKKEQGGGDNNTVVASDVSSDATKGAGQRLADRVQDLPASQRPNTVAVIKHKDGNVTVGRNQGGVQNAEIQAALDRAPSNCFVGQCAEINALSRALNKGRSLDGAVIDVRNVRGVGSTSGLQGTIKQPCTTCDNVLGQFGVQGP